MTVTVNGRIASTELMSKLVGNDGTWCWKIDSRLSDPGLPALDEVIEYHSVDPGVHESSQPNYSTFFCQLKTNRLPELSLTFCFLNCWI